MRVEWKLSASVQHVARVEGISSDELAQMLVESAKFTHEWGNRRFHGWVFHVEGDGDVRAVHRMAKIELTKVGRLPRSVGQRETHDACDGVGCMSCGWNGEVIRLL